MTVRMDSRGLNVASVSVIGLGKLGAPFAAVAADKGYDVLGVDLNPEAVAAINAGRAPVQEPGLQELIDRARSRLRATTDTTEAVAASQMSCIVVPTPSAPSGTFTTEYVEQAMLAIGKALADSDDYHLVVIVSTVMPGDTARLGSVLEEAAGRSLGRDIGLCYSPEFIALGSVINDITRPDMLLIGESDTGAGTIYEDFLLSLVENDPPVSRMNFVNAELAKLAVNGYVTTKITYANMLARICEQVRGADAEQVTRAVGLDSRIGRKYFRGALAYGGPCFPRDNVALAQFAQRLGTPARLAEATHETNLRQDQVVVETIVENQPPPGKAAVLGLAYKPGTPVVEEASGLRLLRLLQQAGYEAKGYDELASQPAIAVLGSPEHVVESVEDALRGADVVVIATPAETFTGLSSQVWGLTNEGALIVDAWRILNGDKLPDSSRLLYLGVGPV